MKERREGNKNMEKKRMEKPIMKTWEEVGKERGD